VDRVDENAVRHVQIMSCVRPFNEARTAGPLD
jgi:hypothetical protein